MNTVLTPLLSVLPVLEQTGGHSPEVSLLLLPAEDERGDGGPRGGLPSRLHQRSPRNGSEPLQGRNRSVRVSDSVVLVNENRRTVQNFSSSDWVTVQDVNGMLCVHSASAVRQQTEKLLQRGPQGACTRLQTIRQKHRPKEHRTVRS